MKQYLFVLSIMVGAMLIACNSHKDNFPNTINVVKTDQLKRIKGTKLFVSTPAGYKPIESMERMQRDDDTYFQAMEIPNSNFIEKKSSLSKEAMESKGAAVDIDKPVKYNGYDAVYFSGPSKVPGETKIGLMFGDETFVMMLVGVCKTADKKAMEELNTIISTSYYDKSFDLNPLELTPFTFDQSITGFKFAVSMGNIMLYSPNGKEDVINKRDELPVFQFITIEALNMSKAKEFLETTKAGLDKQGMTIGDTKERSGMINGNEAYEVMMDAKSPDGKDIVLYEAVIYKGTTAVIFVGYDTEHGKWIDKYKATVQSIKM